MHRALLIVLLALLTTACAGLKPFQEPQFRLNSLELEPGGGFQQVINVGVRIDNPNPYALKLAQINYNIFLEGRELIKGSLQDRLEVPAGGSSDVIVPLQLNLLSGISLANQLLRSPPSSEFKYRMDVGARVLNFGVGNIKLSHEDSIRLQY